MNAFYVLQISSQFTLIIPIHNFHPSACLHQEIRKVTPLLKLIG